MPTKLTWSTVLKAALVVLAITTLLVANALGNRAIHITRQMIHDHPRLLDPDGSCPRCS